MGNEMVERVARAIHQRCGWATPHFPMEDYIEDARAVIEAMREPTDSMRADGRDAIQPYLVQGRVAKPVRHQWQIADETWAAMINGALGNQRSE